MLNRLLIVFFLAAATAQTVCGLILHPDGEPNLVNWTDKPHEDITGRWGTNASCVAVAPNYVITTRHQGGGIATPVQIAGVTYTIDRIYNHPDKPNSSDPNFATVDLRLVKLKSANLQHFAGLYTYTSEASKPVIMSGFGVGRQNELKTDGITYGYSWQNQGIFKNYTQRWGTNIIDQVGSNIKAPGNNIKYNLDLLIADFDRPGATQYETSVAGFDSGGGCFIKISGKWKLAGINWGVENANLKQARFASMSDPNNPEPDTIYLLRISSYADWIYDTIETVCDETISADFNGNCIVDINDFREFTKNWLNTSCNQANNYCQQADFSVDGWVGIDDFGIFSGFWLEESHF